jgi:alginate O-acetyltransferase complex protein AlgI
VLFTTPLFLYVFFPAFFLGYFLVGRRYRNAYALAGSLIFYAWGEPLFVFAVILSVLADYYLGRRIAENAKTQPRRAKMFLAVGIGLNAGLLVVFKYTNFFLETMARLWTLGRSPSFHALDILLPLGISFIVFEKITYLVDLHRGVGKPAKSLVQYALYVFLFPKLLAGPIIQYHDIESQIENRPLSDADVAWGLKRFVTGLAKKVLIADIMSPLADRAFAIPAAELQTGVAWIGVVAFTLQIFFDFSGYSDMAIGMARMMGFTLKENFNQPYLADSFTEFWRRWHISLTSWIRTYLYIPMGGNRGSTALTYFNMIVCFVLSGLWHGASWTFVIWGCFHGTFLVLDKLFWLRVSRNAPRWINRGITCVLVMMGWVLFRSSTFEGALDYYSTLFHLRTATVIGLDRVFIPSNGDLFAIAVGVIWVVAPGFFAAAGGDFRAVRPTELLRGAAAAGFLVLLLGCMVKLSSSSFSPFIYFRF